MTGSAFAGFEEVRIATPRGPIRASVGGAGPPLLLLHGHPEIHLMWHAVAARLAQRFMVVAAKLPQALTSARGPAHRLELLPRCRGVPLQRGTHEPDDLRLGRAGERLEGEHIAGDAEPQQLAGDQAGPQAGARDARR
jgi:hypothetical protein